VLISVIVGARVVTAADSSDTVWAAEVDLAAGTVLTEADLRSVSVSLDTTAEAYLSSSTDLTGRVLTSAIGAGELLARSSVAETSTLVDIALPIAAAYVPPSLQRGQLVDVYALDTTPNNAGPTTPSPEAGGAPESSPVSDTVTVVVVSAVVQLIAGRTDGALSVGSSTIQVVISVEEEQAPAVFAAIAGKELALAVRSSAASPSQDEDRPTTSRDPATPTPATPTD